MANGPKSRVAFRRRRENKTNFNRRLKMIKSRRNRLIIRCSLKNTIVQIAASEITGDKIVVASHSFQLIKGFGWKFSSSSLCSAYLTGYLCGMRAKKANVKDAILDIGVSCHTDHIKAAFKGFLDAGIEVPHNEKWFPKALASRISGEHIKKYADKLSKENVDKYKKVFAISLKNNADPTKIVEEFKKVKDTISKKQ
jgi:large subunit ribosomal protein L18